MYMLLSFILDTQTLISQVAEQCPGIMCLTDLVEARLVKLGHFARLFP